MTTINRNTISKASQLLTELDTLKRAIDYITIGDLESVAIAIHATPSRGPTNVFHPGTSGTSEILEYLNLAYNKRITHLAALGVEI